MRTDQADNGPVTPQDCGGWLSDWRPEVPEFWQQVGSRIAWRTLWVTTYCLLLAFATWFMVSAIVVKLTGLGFTLTKSQLFWLAAMPGLAGGSLRILHTFLIPVLGTRTTVTASTALLALPCLGWAWVVHHPETSLWLLMLLAFISGVGGGNFSSFMPSTSLFFPKRLQGTALGIQAGIGNFGVSVAQFTIPWVITFPIIGGAQTFIKDGRSVSLYMQNAALVWIPFVALGAVVSYLLLRSVPVRASIREQMDIFREKHTWLMTSLYIMTFGSFSGYAAAFPLLIDRIYGRFEGAPDPLRYAFLGAFVGAAARVIAGPISDRFGGARLTALSGLGLLGFAIATARFTTPTHLGQFPGFLFCMLGLFLFSGIGNASTFKQMPMIFPPRQAGGVIGWTSAIAAYGPFIINSLLGAAIAATGSPRAFFIGAAAFYALNIFINWHFYLRRGCERPC